MNDLRKQRLQTLFRQAAGLDHDERALFVDAHCGDDPSLRHDLLSLLENSDEATRQLDVSPDAASIIDTLEPPDLIGERIGPYRLLEHIGHGGMGMVYLGERADGEFRQKVAIKLVRAPWLSAQTLTRFRTERQILARLQHPNIARLLDGGTTLQGQPYLVMEHVDGEPVDRYCAHHNLSTRQRLRLFQDICAAVAYAHRQLVIHRDLKPGNILVTADGVVKLLDFGIAKLIDNETPHAVADGAAATAVHGMALTPEYASPEQIRGEPVTTASDVYSLGVLLYELLTGSVLYRFNSPTLREVEKIVCETPVARPSTAVSRTSRGTTTARGKQERLRSDITPERLRRDLSGDLDTIVITALHKEPEQRYPSVEQFADDIQRHIKGYPVHARPPSRRYRLRKFLQRNAWSTVSVAAIILAVVAGAAAAWVGMLQARAQAALAESRRQDLEQVARFQQSMLADLDPQAMGSGITGALRRQLRDLPATAANPADAETDLASFEKAIVKVNATDVARNLIDEFVLARALKSIASDFDDRPQLQADLYDSVFAVYRSIGLHEPLPDIAQRIIDARQRSGHSEPADHQKARLRHADALVSNGRRAEAETALQALLADAESAGLERSETSWSARNLLAQVHVEQGQVDAARALAQRNLDLARETPGLHHTQATSLGTLGYIAARSRQVDEALVHFRQAADLVDENSPDYLRSRINLAAALGTMGRSDEALAINEHLYELTRDRLGERHIETLRIANNVAANLIDLGRIEEALPLFQRIAHLRAEVLGESDPLTLRSILNLGSAYARVGRGEEGVPLLESVVRQRTAQLGSTHLDTLHAQDVLASTLIGVGRHDAAIAVATQAAQTCADEHGVMHPLSGGLQLTLARAFSDAGRHAESAAAAERLLAAHAEGEPGADARMRLEAALRLYVDLQQLGQRERAGQIRAAHLQPLLAADPQSLDAWQRRFRERIDDAVAGRS